MKTQDAIRFFGSEATLKAALKLKARTEVWGEFPPASRQYQLEVLTNGALKAERALSREATQPASNLGGYTGIERRVWATRPASNDSHHGAQP